MSRLCIARQRAWWTYRSDPPVAAATPRERAYWFSYEDDWRWSIHEANPSGAPNPPVEPPRREEKPPAPPRTRTSAAFKSFVGGTVVLLALLIFILENTGRVKLSYFGATGHLALGVALLLAAVAGALIVAIIGTARISQLRLYARRQRRDKS
jgi:uncharacterized integral membrane protein